MIQQFNGEKRTLHHRVVTEPERHQYRISPDFPKSPFYIALQIQGMCGNLLNLRNKEVSMTDSIEQNDELKGWNVREHG